MPVSDSPARTVCSVPANGVGAAVGEAVPSLGDGPTLGGSDAGALGDAETEGIGVAVGTALAVQAPSATSSVSSAAMARERRIGQLGW